MNDGQSQQMPRYSANVMEFNQLMLRFRPIAPKPVTEYRAAAENLLATQNAVGVVQRRKRKYVRSSNISGENNSRKKRISQQEDGRNDEVELAVTLDGVTATYMGAAEVLGCTDVDKMIALKNDTCPAFISDGFNRVVWVNEAFETMVNNSRAAAGISPSETAVRLIIKDENLFSQPVFSCHVRVRYTWLTDRDCKKIPCDVWRMNGGEVAWRMDFKAALSLSL